MHGGRLQTCRPHAAAFARRISEPSNVLHHRGRIEYRRQTRKWSALGIARDSERLGASGRGAQIEMQGGICGRPLAFGIVGGLSAGECKPGIFAVVGQLARHTLCRDQRIDGHPTDRSGGILRMPTHHDQRMAGKGNPGAAGINTLVIHCIPEGGITREQSCRPKIVASEHPDGTIIRQFAQRSVLDDGEGLCATATPKREHSSIRCEDLGCCRCRQDCEHFRLAEQLTERGRGLPRIKQSEQIKLRIDLETERGGFRFELETRDRFIARDLEGFDARLSAQHHRHLERERRVFLYLPQFAAYRAIGSHGHVGRA